MAISYNEFVKKPKAEVEYTTENIKELNKCSKNIYEFIKYVKIINPDRGEEFFQPYDYQFELLENFQDHRFCCVLAARQSGKCLEKNSKITIRNKKTGKIEDITIKDFFTKFSK